MSYIVLDKLITDHGFKKNSKKREVVKNRVQMDGGEKEIDKLVGGCNPLLKGRENELAERGFWEKQLHV